MQKIVTRKEALAKGLKHYFTGKPCKHGHFFHRYTLSSACAACVNGVSTAAIADVAQSATIDLTEFQTRIYFEDKDLVELACVKSIQGRYPNISPMRCRSRKVPIYPTGTSSVFYLIAHPEDVAELRQYAELLYSERYIAEEPARQAKINALHARAGAFVGTAPTQTISDVEIQRDATGKTIK